MIDIEKMELEMPDVLSSVRQRLGAVHEQDTSYDNQISKMEPKEIIAKYCAWRLGTEEWWLMFLEKYEKLKKLLQN